MDTEHCSNFEEVVEKALDKLAVDENDPTLRRLSGSIYNGRGGRNEESKMERHKSVRAAIRRRQSEYIARRETIKWATRNQNSKSSTIPEEEDQAQRSHMPVARTNTYTDPEGLEERTC